VLTPNHFELAHLSGRAVGTLAQVVEAADALRESGPRTVLVTSVLHADLTPGRIATVVVADAGAWLVTTPLLDVATAGTGDLTAALFTAHLPDGPEAALVRTVSSVHAVLEATPPGAKEIALVAAQDAVAVPPEGLVAERLR
jgi:pyridoxine kinase